MRLTRQQTDAYERDGFLVCPDLFHPAEMELLMDAFRRDATTSGEHVVSESYRLEDGRGERSERPVRSIYASHQRHPEFAHLVRDRRLLEPALQLLGSDAYVYQFKINAKAPFGGEEWAWHQDYRAWKIADDLPAPHIISVAVFLDEFTESNGPVKFVPGSHRSGLVPNPSNAGKRHSHLDPSDIAIGDEHMTDIIRRKGLCSPTGQPGTAVIFHPQVVHGSARNMSPHPRTLLIVTYNNVRNLPLARPPRPAHVVCRDTAPLQPLETTLADMIGRSP